MPSSKLGWETILFNNNFFIYSWTAYEFWSKHALDIASLSCKVKESISSHSFLVLTSNTDALSARTDRLLWRLWRWWYRWIRNFLRTRAALGTATCLRVLRMAPERTEKARTLPKDVFSTCLGGKERQAKSMEWTNTCCLLIELTRAIRARQYNTTRSISKQNSGQRQTQRTPRIAPGSTSEN